MKNYFSYCYDSCHKNGFSTVLPLKPSSKVPALAGWQLSEPIKNPVYFDPAIFFNAGLVTNGYVIFDFDYTDGDLVNDRLNYIRSQLGDGLVRDGALHHYQLLYALPTLAPDSRHDRLRRSLNGTHVDEDAKSLSKCEIRSQDRQCLIFGIHPETGKEITWKNGRSPMNTPRDAILVEWDDLSQLFDTYPLFSSRLRSIEPKRMHYRRKQNTSGLTAEEICQYLAQLESESLSDYHTWLKVLMAIHHETGGSDAGLSLALYFSKKWPGFTSEEEVISKFNSFKYRSSNMTTFKTVMRMVEEQNGIKDFSRSGSPPQESLPSHLTVKEKEYLENLLKNGVPAGIARYVPFAHKPRCFDLFAGMEAENGVIKNILCDELKRNRRAERKNLYELFRRYGISPIFAVGSNPSAELFFNGKGGERTLNLYDSPVVMLHEEYKQKAVDYITKIKEHISTFMCSDPKAQDIFWSWIIWQVTNPGCKVLWAPILCGPNGTGKSFFGQLLSALMGWRNVATIGIDAIASKFTDGFTDKVLIFVEEVFDPEKKGTHERIKTLITEGTLRHEQKGKGAILVDNRLNLAFTTNNVSQLDLFSHDRRFLLLKCPMRDIEVKQENTSVLPIKCNWSDYFYALFSPIFLIDGTKKEYSPVKGNKFFETLRYLISKESLSPLFKPFDKAYVTDDFNLLQTSSMKEEFLEDVQSILTNKDDCQDSITCERYIKQRLSAIGRKIYKNVKLIEPLKALGYIHTGLKCRFHDGQRPRIWMHEDFWVTEFNKAPDFGKDTESLNKAIEELKDKYKNSSMLNVNILV